MHDDTAPFDLRARWIAHGAIRYHYRVGGDDARGTPLVLVHGLGVSSAYWRRIQPLLADDRRVYALDLPGFGRTTRAARSTSAPWRAPSATGWTRSASSGRSTSPGIRWAARWSPPSPAPTLTAFPGSS